MLVPSHSREEDQEKLQQWIREYTFGVLMVADNDGVDANHLPLSPINRHAATTPPKEKTDARFDALYGHR